MFLRMTGLTQRHQVAEIITAAARHGNYVVYLFDRSESTLFQTHLAQRVSRCITLSYLPPRSAVFLVAVGRTDEFIVAAVHLLCVFLAVLSVTSVGAAGVGTGALWSSGHGGSSLFFFADYIIPQRGYCKIVDFTVMFQERSLHAAPCGAFCRYYQCHNPSARQSAPMF